MSRRHVFLGRLLFLFHSRFQTKDCPVVNGMSVANCKMSYGSIRVAVSAAAKPVLKMTLTVLESVIPVHLCLFGKLIKNFAET